MGAQSGEFFQVLSSLHNEVHRVALSKGEEWLTTAKSGAPPQAVGGRRRRIVPFKAEGWLSGLKRWFRKPVGEKSPHRFKSCTLRFERDCVLWTKFLQIFDKMGKMRLPAVRQGILARVS